MGFGPTPEQREAIENEGGRLLVSAAAGSGKTRVLVERLLRKVDGGEDIDRFLVITFTNAAASELRSRIMDAIFDRIAAEPANLRLRRQAGLLGRAHIETIHGFCGSLLREYAHRLRLPPDFRIADEKESSNLKETALNDLLDELYGSGDPEFEALADIMGAGRDDSALVRVILDTHTKLLSHPSPEKWVREQLTQLELSDVQDAGETVWGRSLMEETKTAAGWWLGTLRDVLAECADEAKFMRGYGKSIAATVQGLSALSEALDEGWDSTREALAGVEFPRASAAPGFEREIGLRNACKEWTKKLADIYWDSSDKALEDMRAMAPVMRSLLETVLKFDGRFTELKRKRGVLDFSDQEHLTLKLLTDPETGGPSEAAREISGRFAEIMVDEYQDVNRIQETIFDRVSREGRNIFTVGDVKQSIYRFRLADPTIFLGHYDTFADAASAGEGEPRKVVLSRNFRSKPKILEGVNFIFENIMSRELGDLDYGPRERLYPPEGAEDGPEPRVELDLVSVRPPTDPGKGKKGAGKENADGDGEDSPGKVEAEAMAAVLRVKALVGSMRVASGGRERALAYGDIAILLRSPRNVQAEWQRVFAREGVPLLSSQPVDFFSEYEVSLALSMLSVIDNPRQDIPLITVLRCPVYGFTAEELAEIRLCDRAGDFYSALCKAAETDERCSDFMGDLEELRALAPDTTADEMLWALYTKTRLFAVVSAMPSGQERRENLMLLLEQARSCEGAGIRGLFGFMTWVRRLQARGDGPETVSGGAENTVTLMSTHKSKGLEFPVVILGGLTHRINNEDLRSRLLIHPELGPGPKRVDTERRIEYNTIARRAVAQRVRRETLSEELRILYVAMTRPQERLILLCTYPDAGKAVGKLAGMDLPVPAQLLSAMSCPADWILSAALRRPESESIRFGLDSAPCAVSGSPWEMRLVTPEDLLNAGDAAGTPPEGEAREAAAVPEELRARLEYVYPHRAAASMPSKVTATELKGTDRTDAAAEEAMSLAPELEDERPIEMPERPAFMGGFSGLTPAERGTAAHMVMQYADYGRCRTVQGVKEEIDRLYRMNILTREQAEAVRPELIARFFRTRPGQLMLGAEKLHRELKFSLLMDSDRIPGFAPGEKVLMQGVVDCCAETGGKLTVIDFKTDYVTDDTIEEKSAYYAGQLDAYALAMERVLQKPVERRILCYLTAGKFMEV